MLKKHMVKRYLLFGSLALGGIAGLSPIAFGSLDTDDIQFTGTVPGTCTIESVEDVTMSLSGTTFTGETNQITINANTGVNVSLSAITDNNDTDANAAATADINDKTDNQDNILTTDASESSGSSATALGNTASQDHEVTVKMTVVNADTPGAYSYTITVNCLSL